MSFLKKFEKPTGDFFLYALKFFIVNNPVQPESIDHNGIKDILVVLRHQMGDFLCATPMIRSLRSSYPEAKITLVTKASTNFDLIFKNDKSLVDEVFYFEYGIENFFSLLKELRLKKFGLAVIPSTVIFSATNHLLAYYSNAKIRAGVNSINYEENKVSYLLNIKNDFQWDSQHVHQIERNLDIIRQLKIEPQIKMIKTNLSKESLDFAEKIYLEKFPDSTKPVFGFHPGAGKPGNTWDPKNFALLAGKLAKEFDAYIFISEGPSDKEYTDKMAFFLFDEYSINDYFRHKGNILNNLAIISKTSFFVTNDTGIMHLASGFDKLKMLALFGPTDALEWGPLGEGKYSLQSPTRDINKMNADMVFDACKSILTNKSNRKI